MEGVGRYAIYGRSCTDGGDQLRKKIQLAARRVLRQGPKGALFDAELGLVNGSIIYKWFHEGATVWDFCTRFYDEVVSEVQVRKHFSPAMRAVGFGEPSSSSAEEQPLARTRARSEAHTPVSLADERKRKIRLKVEGVGHRWAGRGFRCDRNDCAPGSSVHPDIWCPGCGKWYHLDCWAKSHVCYKRA